MGNFAGCSDSQYASVLATFGGDVNLTMAVCTSLASYVGQKGATAAVDKGLADLKYGVNTAWLISSGALVFVMHGGFAMLCAGAIRSKNAMNILLQTILDACVSAIAFYLIGFGLAYGEGSHPNPFCGDALFALARYSDSFTGVGVGYWTDFFYQWAFSATAATIPAGAVAERFNFNAYIGYSVFISFWVYPVVAHWVWSRQGWLTYFLPGPIGRQDFLFGSGMIDFAGSAVVHMVGGLTGMVGSIMVGPRIGRFDSEWNPIEMPGHSAILVVLGTVLLWFGWYGFNPGSSLIIDNPVSAQIAARAAVTTTLSGATSGLTALALGFARNKAWDLLALCNGVLVGFVAVTAGAHVLEPWAAIIDGAVASLVFEGMSWVFLYKWKIDDPLSAAPMHAFGGASGILFVGLLAKQEYVQQAYGRSENYGLFYGGGGRLLASQVVGMLTIAAWVAVNMGLFFTAFKIVGLDVSKHGGSAYNHGIDAGLEMIRFNSLYNSAAGSPRETSIRPRVRSQHLSKPTSVAPSPDDDEGPAVVAAAAAATQDDVDGSHHVTFASCGNDDGGPAAPEETTVVPLDIVETLIRELGTANRVSEA